MHPGPRLYNEMLLFVYGLVYFVLGLAALLQWRHYSRLDLARSLPWLAAFGMLHGLHEWSQLVIPRQMQSIAVPLVRLSVIAQLVLLAGSFAFLLAFGVSLLHPLGRERWLVGLPLGALLAWLGVTFFIALPLVAEVDTWRRTASALARYMLCLPGGLVAAYGLLRQTLRHIAPLGVPRIVGVLSMAGVALVLYALVAGAVPPPVPFLPGSVLNVQTVETATGLSVFGIRSAIGLILAVTMIRGLEVFDVEVERLIEDLERQQARAVERERIARELHDGTIQTLYTAGLLVQSARGLAEAEGPLVARLDKALDVLDDAVHALRQNLSELQTPTQVPIRAALRQLAADPRYTSLVRLSVEDDLSDAAELPAPNGEHVLAIVREALANVIRHAQARNVYVAARRSDGRLVVTVRDDGRGLAPEVRAGFGMRDMRDRARLLGGDLQVGGARGKGTTVRLDVPWKDEGQG